MRYFVSVFQFSVLRCLKTKPQLLLGGELLTERCHTDDLMPDLPVPSLPPCRMDPKVLGLDVLIDRSEPDGSWASNGSPPVRWRTQSGGDDTVMIFLLG